MGSALCAHCGGGHCARNDGCGRNDGAHCGCAGSSAVCMWDISAGQLARTSVLAVADRGRGLATARGDTRLVQVRTEEEVRSNTLGRSRRRDGGGGCDVRDCDATGCDARIYCSSLDDQET